MVMPNYAEWSVGESESQYKKMQELNLNNSWVKLHSSLLLCGVVLSYYCIIIMYYFCYAYHKCGPKIDHALILKQNREDNMT